MDLSSQPQEIMGKFAFVWINRNQLQFIENPRGSSSETKVIYASK